MNQLDRCKYININYASGKIWGAVIWIAIALWRLNRGLFYFLGKQIRQTTTRTKSSARGIQNKQFTEVRHCWRENGGAKYRTRCGLSTVMPSSWFSLRRWDDWTAFLSTTRQYGRWTEHWEVFRKETAHLVSFYENLYQHNTGNKKNIMAV